MCSISGILTRIVKPDGGWQKGSGESETTCLAVARMNAALRHRGPDDEGVVSIACRPASPVRICLGNTRLAIIDTTRAGHQPMQDSETGNWITYNGETYNFRELRREIGDQFGPWRSNTDTEVVLRGYRKWGIEIFSKLRGMFALAIWDASKQKLVLARDRFGIKPLYYCQTSDDSLGKRETTSSFIFASEVRALLASGLVPRKLSEAAVGSYLNYGSVQGPLTIIAGVSQLMPGHILSLSDEDPGGRISTFALPDSGSHAGNYPRDRNEAVSTLRDELEESLRFHLVSDVPLGIFLSGGMDSSALVALMGRVSKQKPRTFSVVFDEDRFSEKAYARAVAEKFHTEHCEIHLDEDRLLEMLPAALSALDQPSMDGTNTYVVSRAVKAAGVTVALSGLGSDELFGGYPSFRRVLKMNALPRFTRKMLQASAGLGSVALRGTSARKKFWQLCATAGEPIDVYTITRQLFAVDEIDLLRGNDSSARYARVNEIQTGNGNSKSDLINCVSKLELSGYMANTLLRDTDSMSMAHSLEVRVPFLDPKLVSCVLSLPGEWKLANQNGKLPKPLLADAVGDLLSKQFLSRTKMGFTLPLEKWMQSRLRGEISSAFKSGGAGLDVEVLRKIWQGFLTSPRAIGWTRPWSLYVLIKWCELNGIT